jgi:hypothetical protein
MSNAGGSAQREYERRRARERAAVRSNLPWTVPLVLISAVAGGVLIQKFVGSLGVLAGVLVAVTLGFELWGTSSHISAYGKGAEGERLTGRTLHELPGYVVLHDRKIPGSKANIDHVAIGPGGVFAIETKNYKGEVKARGDDLFVGGQRRTSTVEQTWREAVAVQGALAEHLARLAIDVVPVLCIHGSQVPWETVQGVKIVGPRGLKKLISGSPAKLHEDDIRVMAAIADSALRPS